MSPLRGELLSPCAVLTDQMPDVRHHMALLVAIFVRSTAAQRGQ
jgi:hypothetical protein